MEGEKSDFVKKGEARRQRILENSQKRLNKLKGVEHNKEAIIETNKITAKNTTKSSTTEDPIKTPTNNLLMLLSYQPPERIANIRLTLITVLAVVLPLHNHWQLFGSHQISLVTAFLGLEGQYILAAYSLGWLMACTTNKELNHSALLTTVASLFHLPVTVIALPYCIGTLLIQVVTDFFWYLFIAICTISLDVLVVIYLF